MKFKKNFKKGFTLVELIVVIAIVAILAAVSVVSYIAFINSANESADIQLVKQLNTCLQADEALHGKKDWSGDYKGMTNLLESNGFIVENLTKTKSGCDMVYQGSDKEGKIINRYALLRGDDVLYSESTFAQGSNFKNLWIPETIKEAQDLTNAGKGVVLGTELGEISDEFVAHASVIVNGAKISNIKYEREGAGQKVNITTDTANTNLTIIAKNDTVNHYGYVGMVDAQKIDMNCYNEYGKAAYVKVTEGTVVAKAGGTIEVVFAANDDPEAVAVLRETNGTIERGLTVIQQVSDTNEARTDGMALEYSVDGQTAEQPSFNYEEALEEREAEVDTIAQEAVTDLIDEELEDEVIRAVSADATEFYSFKDFAEKVNDGSFEGKGDITFTLMANVNLHNNEWTPIGTKDHPFKWVFDGNGYSVKNFKITSEHSRGEDALFGFVVGDSNIEAINLEGRWNAVNFTFNTDNIANNYSTVIKNLTVEGASISSGHAENKTDAETYGSYGNKNNRKSAAAIIGVLRCAYAENLIVDNTTINGYKTVGGIVGSLDGGSISKCSTTSTVKVNGYSNVGGLIGGLENANSGSDSARKKHSVIFDCISNSEVNKRTEDKGYGYVGGIIGTAQNDSCAIIDCEVNGKINSINNGTATTDGSKGAVGGIAGQNCAGGYFINCTNNSIITISGSHGYVGGIAEYAGASKLVNCINNSNITAHAVQLAGIVAGALSSNSTQYISCVNNGVLVNTNDANAVYDISSVNGTAEIKNAQFANVSELQESLNAQNLENCGSIKLIDVTVSDTTGTLNIPNSVESINSNNKVCSAIELNQQRTKSLNVNLPGINYEYDGSYIIWFASANSNILVPENITVPLLSVTGANTVVTNRGTVSQGISVKDVIRVDNYGTAGYVNFRSDSNASMIFNNYGIVTGIDGSAKHSLCTTTKINLTVNNRGSIIAGEGNYALLFYGNSTVVFNAYAESTITHSTNMGTFVISNGPSAHAKLVTFNVAEGAAGVSGNKYYGASAYKSTTFDCELIINFNAVLPE